MYERFGLRNTIERFFRYLKERTERFYNNINTWRIQSIEDYAKTIAIIRNLHTIIKTQGVYYLVNRFNFSNLSTR